MKELPELLHEKILRINLDPHIYGAFAEIGAGQETANLFFRVSGAAGTIAKSISAYDMTVSDSLYGKAQRYVSEDRLISMMDCEFEKLEQRLKEKRGRDTKFFAFCNTVKAKAYHDDGNWHGWMGLIFQRHAGLPPSKIILHVRLLDQDHSEQMEALGILGVNLIAAAFWHRDSLNDFVSTLSESLDTNRIEIDVLKFCGHGYEFIDNRLCVLQLVHDGLTDAAMFLPDGKIVQPADALYKKPVMLMRGSFDPVTNLHLSILKNSMEVFKQTQFQESEVSKNCLEICEISMHNLLREGSVQHLQFLDRADALQQLGKTVMVSRLKEFHRVSSFLNRFTTQPIGITLSIGLLNELFKEKWSTNLPGGILESFGRLFKNSVKLYVTPWKNKLSNELVTASTFHAPQTQQHLYEHFRQNQLVIEVPSPPENLLQFTGRDIQRMIQSGDETWKNYVPVEAHRAAMTSVHDDIS